MLPSFVTRFLYSLNHIKRNPELDPCFIAVAIACRIAKNQEKE